MGFFDNLKKSAEGLMNQGTSGNINAVQGAVGIANSIGGLAGNKSVDVTFAKLPESVEEFRALPQAACTNPFDAAALTVAALCCYPKNREMCFAMLDVLRGPRPLSGVDKQFINDRFMDGKDYIPRSYFKGATPQNDYTPAVPYVITISENPYSYHDQGYAKLYLQSGGADSQRYIQLRMLKDGKWCLWEQFILSDIRQPESSNPWA